MDTNAKPCMSMLPVLSRAGAQLVSQPPTPLRWSVIVLIWGHPGQLASASFSFLLRRPHSHYPLGGPDDCPPCSRHLGGRSSSDLGSYAWCELIWTSIRHTRRL